MTDYAAKLTKLDKDAERIRAKLLELTALRRHLVIAAADNDEAAKRKILTNEAEAVHLQSELTLIADAVNEIEAKQREEAKVRIEQEQAKREADAAELVISIMAANNEIDRALNDLCKRLGSRHQLLISLERTKCRNVPNRLIGSKYCVTAACRAAGLQNHIEIGHVEPNHVVPLVESNRSFGTIPPPSTLGPTPAHVKPPAAPAPTSGPARYIG
jgi:hypothetical protein